jgi:16S rRNA (guanine1207-N2)-methyltransferase
MTDRIDAVCAALVQDLWAHTGAQGAWLWAGDMPEPTAQGGPSVRPWRRQAFYGPATLVPPAATYDGAALRAPKSRPALDLALHLIAGALPAGAPLWVVGANDEGIKSVGKRLGPLFEHPQTLDTRRHCRVWSTARSDAPAQTELESWKLTNALDIGSGPQPFVSYPGCFAGGQLDPGTALLIRALPTVTRADRVLDLACGIGVLGAAMAHLHPHAQIDGCDIDSLSVHAAAHNAPYARLAVGDGPEVLPPPEGGWNAIVSNPPLHSGVRDDLQIARQWIAVLPGLLAPGGVALLVVQRHRPVLDDLSRAFGDAQIIEESGGYRVYRCLKA